MFHFTILCLLPAVIFEHQFGRINFLNSRSGKLSCLALSWIDLFLLSTIYTGTVKDNSISVSSAAKWKAKWPFFVVLYLSSNSAQVFKQLIFFPCHWLKLVMRHAASCGINTTFESQKSNRNLFQLNPARSTSLSLQAIQCARFDFTLNFMHWLASRSTCVSCTLVRAVR